MAPLDELKQKTGELLDEGLRAGVLTTEEHSWRKSHLATVASARDLDVLVEDLLGPSSSEPSVPAVRGGRSSQLNLMSSRTFLSGDLGRRTELVTLLGSTRIDLRDVIPGEALTVELVTVMGDTIVEVPEGVRVHVEATPVMGDCRVDPTVVSADARVRITGVVLMGSLSVVPARRSVR
jgi:hypothetical protein